MIVRSLDANHDWTFGKGKNDYLANNDAIAQNINTRLLSFTKDCFFDARAGVDWWTLLGGKSLKALELAVTSVILNTEGITALIQLSINLNQNRQATISYQVATIYSADQTLGDTLTVGGI